MGVFGELWLGGVQVARGYLKRPEKTADVFVPHPWTQTDPTGDGVVYRTGDRARWYADGEIEFGGRIDFQVKLRGQRIELGEIESALSIQPDILEAIVLLRSDVNASEPMLVAYVHPASAVGASLHETSNARPFDRVPALGGARGALPLYMLPSLVVGIDEWPRTSSNKIDRKLLPAPVVERAAAPMSKTEQLAPITVSTRSLERHTDLAKLVVQRLRDTLHAHDSSQLDLHSPLMDLGLSSLQAVVLMRSLSEDVGTVLPATLCFEYPTAHKLTAAIEIRLGASAHTLQGNAQSPSSASAGSFALNAVAVDGMSALIARGAVSVIAASRLVACGCNAVSDIPLKRWDVHAVFHGLPESIASRGRYGGFANCIELFDCVSFAVSTAEAAVMDPAQRLLLERDYDALQSSQQDRASLEGSITGVFVGIIAGDYSAVLFASPAGSSVYASTSTVASVACGRLAYVLGLHGPAAAYDTACSSALTACHAGLRAVQLEECLVGIVSAANLMFTPSAHTLLAVAGMTSILGRCHTFDRCADGYARSEAVVALALVQEAHGRLPMPGSAVQQDGRSASLTAPNGQAQTDLLMVAHTRAGASADSVTLNEAHGTGTALGDPIEAGALVNAVLNRKSDTAVAAHIGSFKANIGHAEASAGAAGLLKLVQETESQRFVTNAQLHVLNEHVDYLLCGSCSDAMLTLAMTILPLSSGTGGVSSFGYSGTIAHTVLTFGHRGVREALAFGRAADSSEVLGFGPRGADQAGGPVLARCSERDAGRLTFEGCARLSERQQAHSLGNSVPRLTYRRRAFPWGIDPSGDSLFIEGAVMIDTDIPLMAAGLNSIAAIRLAKMLEETTRSAVSSTLLFDFPTARKISDHFSALGTPDLDVLFMAQSLLTSTESTTESPTTHDPARFRQIRSVVGLDDDPACAHVRFLSRKAQTDIAVFAIPAGIGHSDGYKQLGSIVDGTLYGILHQHFESGLLDDLNASTLQELANAWASAILSLEDSFSLLGASLGGFLTFHTACATLRAGSAPKMIVLLDPMPLTRIAPMPSSPIDAAFMVIAIATRSNGAPNLEGMTQVLDQDLGIFVAIHLHEMNAFGFSSQAVIERQREIRVATHLLRLTASHLSQQAVNTMGLRYPQDSFDQLPSDSGCTEYKLTGIQEPFDVLLVVAGEREGFFTDAGYSVDESSVEATKAYGTILEELVLDGDHLSVCVQCAAAEEEPFNDMLTRWLAVQPGEPHLDL